MPFPLPEEASDYTASPWLDSFGQQWLYDATKNRWNAYPSAETGGGSGTGGGITVSPAEPPSPYSGMRWFRSIDGVTYTYYDGFWVANDSAPIPALDDVWAALDTKLSQVAQIIEVTATDRDMIYTDANNYLRFTSGSAKLYRVKQGDGVPIGSAVTLRNAGAGLLSIDKENINVTINGEGDLPYTVPFRGNAQLIKIADNTWDYI